MPIMVYNGVVSWSWSFRFVINFWLATEVCAPVSAIASLFPRYLFPVENISTDNIGSLSVECWRDLRVALVLITLRCSFFLLKHVFSKCPNLWQYLHSSLMAGQGLFLSCGHQPSHLKLSIRWWFPDVGVGVDSLTWRDLWLTSTVLMVEIFESWSSCPFLFPASLLRMNRIVSSLFSGGFFL